MEIVLTGIAKHFGREIVLQGLSCRIGTGTRTAILGPNGSGKSTLLQLLGGALVPTQGTITHHINGSCLAVDAVYPHVALASPYLGLYEDLSLEQTLDLHFRMKRPLPGLTVHDVARSAYLDHALRKPVAHFSSGMKQRLKLALAIMSDTALLLLDEPASNLDAEAVDWFRTALRTHVAQRTLVIASNAQAVEHDLCTATIDITQYKGR
jgi:ABC-type multidrug transport system ATPase subunit